MAGKSTSRRWVNVSGLEIGTVAFHDAIASSINLSAQPLGSNSQTDSYANHFVTAIQAGADVTFRTYDVFSVEEISGLVGDLVNVKWSLLKGKGVLSTETQCATMTFSSNATYNNGGMMITKITIPGEHDQETMCEITGVLRSNGASAPWKVT